MKPDFDAAKWAKTEAEIAEIKAARDTPVQVVTDPAEWEKIQQRSGAPRTPPGGYPYTAPRVVITPGQVRVFG